MGLQLDETLLKYNEAEKQICSLGRIRETMGTKLEDESRRYTDINEQYCIANSIIHYQAKSLKENNIAISSLTDTESSLKNEIEDERKIYNNFKQQFYSMSKRLEKEVLQNKE